MIGITGVARSGKDTLFYLLSKRFKEKNIFCRRFALADNLKSDLFALIRLLFDIDIYTMTAEQKEMLRPIFVVYGKHKRQSSNGRYWIDKLNKDLEKYKNILPIITDVRYCEFENDEVSWLKNEMNGILIHVSREINGSLVAPANEEEDQNDKKIINMSDYQIRWKTQPDKDALYAKHLNDLDKIIEIYESRKSKM